MNILQGYSELLRSVSRQVTQMRSLLVLIAILAPCVADAGCTYVAELRTKNLFLEISDGDCSEKSLTISFTRKIQRDGEPDRDTIKKFPFDKECTAKWNQYHVDEFVCQPNGHTPLAGATYKRQRYGTYTDYCPAAGESTPKPTEVDGYLYRCVAGCSNTTPEVLDERTFCD